MKAKVLTKIVMATAIAFSFTGVTTQPSYATRTEHPNRCNTNSQNNCNNNHLTVCNDNRPNDCNSDIPTVCNDNRPNDCNSDIPTICNDNRPNDCSERKVETCPSQHWNPCQPRPSVEHTKPPTITNRFFCSDNNGVPTTFVETQKGSFPIIRWVSTYFSDHGYEPITRCRQVSSKFQQFFNNGTLNYITTGTVNSLPVICVSNTKGGACTGVLFTLKPGEDANRIIRQLFDIRSGAAGPLEESGSRLYFDMKNYLKTISGSGVNSSHFSPNSGTSGADRSGAW
ncbi:hypothetical protein BCD67_12025 [Oscillatoriales cyanobacterium USR001]|nr:hypothetical protein BCD67_12025 [Oscillatoriales cyanobacterium USR001]